MITKSVMFILLVISVVKPSDQRRSDLEIIRHGLETVTTLLNKIQHNTGECACVFLGRFYFISRQLHNYYYSYTCTPMIERYKTTLTTLIWVTECERPFISVGGRCVKVINRLQTLHANWQACEYLGGQLVSIGSRTEMQALVKFTRERHGTYM